MASGRRIRTLRTVDGGFQEIGARGAGSGVARTIGWTTKQGELTTDRQITSEATAPAESLARQIQFFEDRCRRITKQIEGGILQFVHGLCGLRRCDLLGLEG
jgi:hypothetical protein